MKGRRTNTSWCESSECLGGFQHPRGDADLCLHCCHCPDIPVNDIQDPRAGTCTCSCPWQGAQSAQSALALPVPSQSSSCSNQTPLSQVSTEGNTLYREMWVRSPSQGCRGQCPAVQAPPAASVGPSLLPGWVLRAAVPSPGAEQQGHPAPVPASLCPPVTPRGALLARDG